MLVIVCNESLAAEPVRKCELSAHAPNGSPHVAGRFASVRADSGSRDLQCDLLRPAWAYVPHSHALC